MERPTVSSVDDLFLAQVKAPEVVVSETASLGNAWWDPRMASGLAPDRSIACFTLLMSEASGGYASTVIERETEREPCNLGCHPMNRSMIRVPGFVASSLES